MGENELRCLTIPFRGREHLDTLNRTLLDRIQTGGEAFVSNAVLGGRCVLRACIVNFNTRASDMEALVELSARVGREIASELRPAAHRPGE